MPTENEPRRLPPYADIQLFLHILRKDLHDPDPAESFLRIPDGLPPHWAAFFDKLVVYCKNECDKPDGKPNFQARITWEKRLWAMEDNGLNEFDMISSAHSLKEQTNEYFRRGDYAVALALYFQAIQTFPLPDAMNNLAACALKIHRFDLVEEWTTKALNIGYLTSAPGRSKALYRRALAREHMGKFNEALGDINVAITLQPNDLKLKEMQAQLIELQKTINTPKKLKRYLAGQPTSAPKMAFSEALTLADQAKVEDIQYLGSMPVDWRKTQAPIF